MTQPFMGVAEIGERLGVTGSRVHQIIASDETFPRPVAELRAGRIWRTADIERWITRRDKRRAK